MTSAGFPVYRSEVLAKCWKFGYSSTADFSFETAAYVARYSVQKLNVSKKSTELDKEKFYRKYLDVKTGVIRVGEFNLMSRGGSKKGSGGIGLSWYRKYKSDMFPKGTKVVNGFEVKTPRYYDNKFFEDDPVAYSKMKSRRNSLINVIENSMMRLLVKEEVMLCKVAQLRRDFEYVEKSFG